MQTVYFIIAAIALYFISDWVLIRVERRLGHRLEHRTAVFFVILLTLALVSFWLVRQVAGE